MEINESRFTKLQAENLCTAFQFLKGKELPSEYDPVYVHNLEVVQVSKGEYDVVLVSGYETIPTNMWDDVRPVTNMYIMDYLKVMKIANNPKRVLPSTVRTRLIKTKKAYFNRQK